MQRIKVMHILSDTNFGGAGQYLKAIVENLSTKDFELSVVLPRGSVLSEIFPEDLVTQVDGIGDKSIGIEGIFQLLKCIGKVKPDIVHTHGSLSGRIAAQLVGTRKIIYTKHTLSNHGSKVKTRMKGLINKLLRAEVVAVSNEVRRNLLEEGIKDGHIRVIYNGVPIKAVSSCQEKEIPIIALVGRLEKIKGHHHMLEITRCLMKIVDTPVKVLFTGEGSLRSTLSKMIESEGLPIEMTGHVAEIDAIYEQADIVVNTSESEALPFSVLEAMNLGRPVVAFELPSIVEVIAENQTGYLIPMYDHALFAQKLKLLLENPTQREHLGRQAHERVRSIFSLESMIQKIEALYKEGL